MPDFRGVGISLSNLQWIDLFQKSPLSLTDIEAILRSIEAQSNWRRPNIELIEIKQRYESQPDESISETLRVRELPFTDRILELRALANPAELRALEKEAYEDYLSSTDAKQSLQQGLESSFLVARFLYRAIRDNSIEVFRHKPFIYPIHQYLSQMIRTAEEIERKTVLATLREWLRSKETYETTRDFAAFELGMSKAHDAKNQLLEAVEDPFELALVRYYAAMALGMIASKSTLIRLLKILNREEEPQMKNLLAHVILHISNAVP